MDGDEDDDEDGDEGAIKIIIEDSDTVIKAVMKMVMW
jgi:hypothetical protein